MADQATAMPVIDSSLRREHDSDHSDDDHPNDVGAADQTRQRDRRG